MGNWILEDDVVLPDTTDWLLAGDASIRWQTRRDLLDEKPDIHETDRAEVATTGWGRRLLECQDPGVPGAEGFIARSGRLRPTRSCCCAHAA